MKKILALLLLAILILFWLAPAKTEVNEEQDFVLGIKLDKTSYGLSESVTIILTITNMTNSYRELTFNTAQVYNYIIYKDSKAIYNWALGRMFADVITTLKFSPNETKSYLEKWDMKDNAGSMVKEGVYKIEFSLKTSNSLKGSNLLTSIEFVIGNVSFEPVFKDVSDYFIAKHLGVLFNRGIVKGYPDGTFKGDRTLSRAEAAALIVRIIKGNSVGPFDKNTFIDVTHQHWAFNYVEYVARNELMEGKTMDTFEPNTPVTRAEFVRMVALAFAIVPQYEIIPSPFADVPESFPGERLIVGAFNQGVIIGKEVKNNKLYFYPDDTLKRSEAILIIGRAIEITGG